MKKTLLIILTIGVGFLWSTNSFSGETELYGALIGAGSGAIIGHAIGGSTESAVIGTAIGGAIGVTATKIHRGGFPFPPPPPFFLPPLPPPPDHRGYRRGYHNQKRHHLNRHSGCKYINKRVYRNGHYYFVSKKVCRADRGYDDWDRSHRRWERHNRW